MSNALHVLAPHFRRQWRALAVASFSTVLIAGAEVLRPFPLKLVIDHLFAGGGAPDAFDVGREEVWLLVGVAGLVLGIALLDAVAGYVMDVRLLRAGERIVHDLRIAIYSHLQRLSLGFHQRQPTGDLVTRVTGDVNAVGTLFSSSLATLVSAVLTLVGMIVVSLFLDPLLALVAFATAPLLAAIAFRFRRRTRVLARRQRAMEGEIASLAEEALGSIQQVKALGSERYEHERLERKSAERLEVGYEASLVEGRFARLIDVVGALGTAAVLVVGVFRVEAGAITPGELVVMAAYARRVYRPLRTLAREWVRLSRVMARAERVADVLATDDLLEDRGTDRGRAQVRGELRFDGVVFAYEAGRPALDGVSLTIPAGQRLAVVGRSGAGKSTLAALAARFYDPDGGRVLIDGDDARNFPLDALREQIGLVLQDTALFTGTVAENIAWGIDADRDDVVRVARAAGADDFVRALPDGYDTRLDPGGAGLSGGQRQRIAIARTLLRDPAILLLDEPTSGLDARSEADVLAGLDALMRGRTTVMITHSLALARRADRAVVLDGGRVVQEGAPEALLRAEGTFRQLAEEQGIVERAPARRAARAFADPELPQAPVLLDGDAVAPVLARSFDGGAPLDVRVRYLRYKPGTNLVVHYDVRANGSRHDAVGMIVSGTYLARRAAKPQNVALAERVRARVAAAEPLAYDGEVGCLVQWYPLDLSLPSLAAAPEELRAWLASAGVRVARSGEEPERLAYKPRRRAVLRVDGHVVKLYAKEEEFERALAGQRASTLPGVTTPPLETALPERLLTVQPFLDGRPVPDAAAVAGAAGALVRVLQRSAPDGVRVHSPRDQLEAARASARLAGTIAPALRPRLVALLSSLAESLPRADGLVPAHGDFNARQLLLRDDGLAVTDFDELCLASPSLDPATYAAYLVRGRPGDLGTALEVLEELLDGYGGRPPDQPWYLATMILRRAPRPFRYLDEGWPEGVDQMVAAAEEALRS